MQNRPEHLGLGWGRWRYVKAALLEGALERESNEQERANHLALAFEQKLSENAALKSQLEATQAKLHLEQERLRQTTDRLAIGSTEAMTSDIRMILGKQYFECAPIARYLRAMGQTIGFRPADEQAAAIYWQLQQHIMHGSTWIDHVHRALKGGVLLSAAEDLE